MNANAQLIESLERSETFQNYQRAFTEATKLPLALRPLSTWQLALHGKRRENPFCSRMAGASRTCAACLQMQAQLAESAREKPCTMDCSYGLCETAVPIKLADQTIGYLQTGQVSRHRLTGASFGRAVATAALGGINIDSPEAREDYLATPVLSDKMIESVTHLLSSFADLISLKCNQIAVQSANAEPPIITRARQFIHDHHADEITLNQTAAALHISNFYLCKLFRKVTGNTFTEYVSRTRVERAKNLLLNRNLRVSEIAFAVGFQSLTHFNRVFKFVVGESPTRYRARLPKHC